MDTDLQELNKGPVEYQGQSALVYNAWVGDDIVVRDRAGRYHVGMVRNARPGRFVLAIPADGETHVVEFEENTGMPNTKGLRQTWLLMGPLDKGGPAEIALRGISAANRLIDDSAQQCREAYWRNYIVVPDMSFEKHHAFEIEDQDVLVRQYTAPGHSGEDDEVTEFVWFDPDGGYHERIVRNIQARWGVPLKWVAEARLDDMLDEYKAGTK